MNVFDFICVIVAESNLDKESEIASDSVTVSVLVGTKESESVLVFVSENTNVEDCE